MRLLSASGRWFTIKELAEQMGCSKSTIERDLATLEAVFPLAEERAGVQKRRYRIDLRDRAVEAMQPFGAMRLAAFGIYDDQTRAEEIEIHFSAEVAWLIHERVFHPAERKERLPDGGVRYRLRSTAQQEIVRWVLQFRGEAELVAPAAWRAEIARLADEIARRHAGGDAP